MSGSIKTKSSRPPTALGRRLSTEVEDASAPRRIDPHNAGMVCLALASAVGVGALLTHLAYLYGWAGVAILPITIVVILLAFADMFLAH